MGPSSLVAASTSKLTEQRRTNNAKLKKMKLLDDTFPEDAILLMILVLLFLQVVSTFASPVCVEAAVKILSALNSLENEQNQVSSVCCYFRQVSLLFRKKTVSKSNITHTIS